MPDTAHAPTPWKHSGNAAHIGSSCVFTTHQNPRDRRVADAAHIVRAVNAHDDLVAALEQCRSELVSIHHGGCDMEHAEKHSAGLRMANAALAAMEG